MNTHQFKLLGISLILAAGLTACDKPGPAESAGKKLDETASDAGKKVSEATDKLDKKLSDAGNKTGTAIEDTEITTRVKTAFLAETGLDSLKMTVDTVNGVVTLGGTVDTAALNDRAKALAAGVPGVKDVVNHLTTTAGK